MAHGSGLFVALPQDLVATRFLSELANGAANNTIQNAPFIHETKFTCVHRRGERGASCNERTNTCCPPGPLLLLRSADENRRLGQTEFRLCICSEHLLRRRAVVRVLLQYG